MENNASPKKIDFAELLHSFLARISSRKFLVAMFAALLPVLNSEFGWGLSTSEIQYAIGILAMYLGVEGYIDNKRGATK